ncbi:actin-3-like isoform X3 [Monodelphis domestica]|uniref:actin-3-like isoform X3 n=1 Tax=Monodelphis domestica TaxID=13616 RepID=UPI0024E1F968|nr:actin-3-like isoform X3 [Monodelphis domestica]
MVKNAWEAPNKSWEKLRSRRKRVRSQDASSDTCLAEEKLIELGESLPVIFDGGSRYFKVGYGGEYSPRFVFPSAIGHYRWQNIKSGMDLRDTFIGNEVIEKWANLLVKYPIEHGIIVNWDDMEKIWHHSFYNVLHVDPEKHPLLVTEHLFTPKANKEKLIEVMFESFRVPALYVAIQDILSLFSSGRTSGLIVNSGDQMTYGVPIEGGDILPDSIMTMEVAGHDLSMALMKSLVNKGYSLCTMVELNLVRAIKEKLCYVALDFFDEMFSEDATAETFTLPDGRIISVKEERYRVPEAFFQPSLLSMSTRDRQADFTCPGLHKSIHELIMNCDPVLRKIFKMNTILCGGSMAFPGMERRMVKELQAQEHQLTNIKVIVPSECWFSSWCGGSILTGLNSFQHMWIYDYEYQDIGATIIHRRCF